MNRRKSWSGPRVHKECVYSCFLGCSVRITMLCERCIRSFVSGSFYPLWNEECMYNFLLYKTTCMFLKYKDSWRLPFWYIKPTFQPLHRRMGASFWGAVITFDNFDNYFLIITFDNYFLIITFDNYFLIITFDNFAVIIFPTLLANFIVIFRRPSYFFLLTLRCCIKCQRYERYFEQSYLTWPTFQQVTFIFCWTFIQNLPDLS